MLNPYTKMLPQPAAEDKREAVKELRQFAEALQRFENRIFARPPLPNCRSNDSLSPAKPGMISICWMKVRPN